MMIHMGADNRRELFQLRFKDVNISKAEIIKIIDGLVGLVDSGMSRVEIDKIINEISINKDFKTIFLKSPQNAIKELR